MLLVVGFHSLVQQWIQTDQEQHVHDQQWYRPNHKNDNEFDDGSVPILEFTLASRTKLPFFSLDFVGYSRHNHILAVTENIIVSSSLQFGTGSINLLCLFVPHTHHFSRGTFSMTIMRSVSWVLFKTELKLFNGHSFKSLLALFNKFKQYLPGTNAFASFVFIGLSLGQDFDWMEINMRVKQIDIFDSPQLVNRFQSPKRLEC